MESEKVLEVNCLSAALLAGQMKQLNIPVSFLNNENKYT